MLILSAGFILAPIIFVCFWVNDNYSDPGQLMKRGLAFELGFFYWPLLTFLGFLASVFLNSFLLKPFNIMSNLYNKHQLKIAERKLSGLAEKNIFNAPFELLKIRCDWPIFELESITLAEELSLSSWPARSLGKFLAINDVTESLAKNFEWQGDIWHSEDDFYASIKWTPDGPESSVTKRCAEGGFEGKWSQLQEKHRMEKIDASISEKVANLEKKLVKEQEKFDAVRSGVPSAVKTLNNARKNFHFLPTYLIENLTADLRVRIGNDETFPICLKTDFICPDTELVFRCGLLKYPDPYNGEFPISVANSSDPSSLEISSKLAIKLLQNSWVEENLTLSPKKNDLVKFLIDNDLSIEVKASNPVQIIVSEETDAAKQRIFVS